MPSVTEVLVNGPHRRASDLVQKLSSAPSLSSLMIMGRTDFDFETGDVVDDTAWPDSAFKSLTTVETTYEAINSLLRHSILSSKIQVLTLSTQLPRADLPTAVARAFRLIGSCRHLTSLTFYIRANEDQRNLETLIKPPKYSSTCPSTVSLEQLLPLHQLRKLLIHDFSNSLVPSWTHAAASRVASSWQQLHHLSWSSSVAATSSTLTSLSPFAGCESLRCLSVPLDATVEVAKGELPTFKNRLILGVSDWVVTTDVVKRVAASIKQPGSEEDGPHGIHWSGECDGEIWYQVEREIQAEQRRRRHQLFHSD